MGVFRVWGEVGVDDFFYFVFLLVVEFFKFRFCLDVLFLNLWMRDVFFFFDKLFVVCFMCLNLS